ncbi:hypothetical protein ES708_03241 [subsurface metagenome]
MLALALWLNSHRRQASTLTTKSLTPVKPGINKITNFVSKLPKKWIIPPLLVIAILVSVAAVTMPDDNLHVSFLNVGQGDAILIQKGNQQVLVDGGPSPQAIILELGEGVVIRVLNPQIPHLAGTESDIDNNGMVLHISMGEVSFLLTADIMWQAEFELTTHRANLTSTVLKVAHHGSDTSTTPEFLAVVNPQLAVISVGAKNRFGHPTPEVMERLEEKLDPENIYRTDELGTIEFITDGERLWVRVEKKGESN